MKYQILFIAWITGLFSGIEIYAQNCHATLYGTVTDAETKDPVPYAEVFLPQTGQGKITDEKGRFVFTELCEGKYTVTCQHIGCSHQSKNINLVGEMSLNFQLTHETFDLGEVVIMEKAIAPKAAQAERSLENAALDAAKGQTLGDMLKKLPGVTTLNTGGTISKPVIRGMHSNRVLMLNNGVRQEGQQWGADHAPEIDPYIAGKVSVVYGANSVRYGADAIGGVVVVEPDPLRTKKGTGGEVQLAGFSNGRSGAFSGLLNFNTGGKIPLAGRVQGTLRRGGNLRAPDYYLENTGVSEANYAATLGLQRERWQSEVFFSQFFTRNSIFKGSHIGNLTDLQNAIDRGRPLDDGSFSYELGRPQQRVAHYLLKVKNQLKTGSAGKLTLQYARQFNRREEFDAHKRFNEVPSNFDNPEMMFEITTHTIDAAWEHKSWRHFTGSIGAQLVGQVNTTDRGGLIPDFNSRTAGIFWIERWRKYPLPLEFEAGVRYDARWLDVGNRGRDVIDMQLNFNNFSGTLGAIYKVNDEFDIRLHAGSAWRAPGVNELFSDGVHHGSASYEKGRSDLKAEQAVTTSLTFDFDNERNFSASLSLYRNFIRDFIYLQPQQQPVLTIRGAFPSFAYEQTDARLTGLDWNANWKPIPQLTLTSSASLLRARNQADGEWINLMPADRFRQGVRWEFGKDRKRKQWQESYAGVSAVHVFEQTRAPENQDFAPPPPAFTLFDFEAGTSLQFGNNKANIGLAVQNIFNTAYRDYLNRLRYYSDEMGRNVSVRLKMTF